MLILVGVSVAVALNGGLFSTAKEAAEGTASKRNEELELSNGKVEINGESYNSIDEYVNGSGNGAGEQKVTITPKKETYTIGEEAEDYNNVNSWETNNAYWDKRESAYPLNLNDTPTSADTDAIAKARAYGTALGGTGRLMTKEEAYSLKTEEYKDILYGTNGKSSSGYLYYWLGTAGNGGSLWYVDGNQRRNLWRPKYVHAL